MGDMVDPSLPAVINVLSASVYSLSDARRLATISSTISPKRASRFYRARGKLWQRQIRINKGNGNDRML